MPTGILKLPSSFRWPCLDINTPFLPSDEQPQQADDKYDWAYIVSPCISQMTTMVQALIKSLSAGAGRAVKTHPDRMRRHYHRNDRRAELVKRKGRLERHESAYTRSKVLVKLSHSDKTQPPPQTTTLIESRVRPKSGLTSITLLPEKATFGSDAAETGKSQGLKLGLQTLL